MFSMYTMCKYVYAIDINTDKYMYNIYYFGVSGGLCGGQHVRLDSSKKKNCSVMDKEKGCTLMPQEKMLVSVNRSRR